ncbi:MarR family winged helix-turn-helix transcriptional regulator [Acetobacter sp. DsW_063]|uniref:MarR family winged helix-turn-helix transcriptional regulator n=1 Tax=Acetobacter sp. DsW_063 TaxID=1514894 RepID=UPI000A3D2033|nr:MarR family transcriptional regulator [Acetobacter sp. DsW_063]OUJ16033.1 MarR family transcriptional regulator [Acetobacter sp. DsW_063]
MAIEQRKTSTDAEDAPGDGVLFLREQQLRLAQELLILTARDMGEAIAPVLEELKLGGAQHRALQMLALHPGMTVGSLQDALGVTKQSLARTLSELQDRGMVTACAGTQDRRCRFLELTATGKAAEARLFGVQRERLVAAYRDAGGPAVAGFRHVLRGLLTPESKALLGGSPQTREPMKGRSRDGK